MPAVLSTTSGVTVIYLSSTWPWSLHMSFLSLSIQRNMTFWNDLMATFAQLILLTSSAVVFKSYIGGASDVGGTYLSTTTSPYSQSHTTFQSLKTHDNGIDSYRQHHRNLANKSSRHNNNNNNNSSSSNSSSNNNNNYIINNDRLNDNQNISNNSSSNNIYIVNSEATATLPNGVVDSMSGKMFNLSSTYANSMTPVVSSMNETILIGTNNYGNLATTSSTNSASNVVNNLVDCNDFTEQKLLNIVICSISDVNSNIINGTSADNSTFNDTYKDISDDLIRFDNSSTFFNGTEVSGNNDTGNKATEFETTVYFIQVITTAVVLGIIILATVIGELSF